MKKKPLVNSLFLNRKSQFAFSSEPVEKEKLFTLFEAAGLAPSSFNSQPWRYIYASRKDPGYSVLFNLLTVSNQQWAGRADVLVLSVAEVKNKEKGRINHFAFHDLGLSTANLLLQATSLGLYTHPMGGYDADKAREVFGIPDGFEPGAMIAIGYPGDSLLLSEELQRKANAPRVRKEIGEFVFNGKWGSPD